MQSANFNGSSKNDNFQLKYFVLCFLFLLRNRLWTVTFARIIFSSQILFFHRNLRNLRSVARTQGCKGYKSLHRRVIMLK